MIRDFWRGMGFENGELWVKILKWIDGGGKGIREGI